MLTVDIWILNTQIIGSIQKQSKLSTIVAVSWISKPYGPFRVDLTLRVSETIGRDG